MSSLLQKYKNLSNEQQAGVVVGGVLVVAAVVVLVLALVFSGQATSAAKTYHTQLGTYISKLDAAKGPEAVQKALDNKPKLKSVPLNFLSSDYKQAQSQALMQSMYQSQVGANLANRTNIDYVAGLISNIRTDYIDAESSASQAGEKAYDKVDEKILNLTSREKLGELRLQQKKDEFVAAMNVYLQSDTAYRDTVKKLPNNPYITDYRDQLLRYADGLIEHDETTIKTARAISFDGGIVRLRANDELLRRQFLTSKADLELTGAALWRRADDFNTAAIRAMRITYGAESVPTSQPEAVLAAQMTYYADAFADTLPKDLPGSTQRSPFSIARANLAILANSIQIAKVSDSVKKAYQERLGAAAKTLALLPNNDSQTPIERNLSYFSTNVVESLDLWQSEASYAATEHSDQEMTDEINAIKQSATYQLNILLPAASFVAKEHAAYVKQFSACLDIMDKIYDSNIHYNSDTYLEEQDKYSDQYRACRTRLQSTEGAALSRKAADYQGLSASARAQLSAVSKL
jgi:hypothetical protein